MKVPYQMTKHFTKRHKMALLNWMLRVPFQGRNQYELQDYTAEQIVSSIWLNHTPEEKGVGTKKHRFVFDIWIQHKHYRTGEIVSHKTSHRINLLADDSYSPGKISCGIDWNKEGADKMIDNVIKMLMVGFLKDHSEVPIYL